MSIVIKLYIKNYFAAYSGEVFTQFRLAFQNLKSLKMSVGFKKKKTYGEWGSTPFQFRKMTFPWQ
jgi:hypothetical protein